jgi:uncharacterized protein
MEVFTNFLAGMDNSVNRGKTEEVLSWIKNKYTNLNAEIRWNQPMFTDHGTFIMGFSVSKKHLAVAPESVTIIHFEDDIMKAGYDHTKELIRIPWNHPVNYQLLAKMIEFNILDKTDCFTFWRK